jgi:hypothetical protein
MKKAPRHGHRLAVVALASALAIPSQASAESKANKFAASLRDAFRTPELDYRPTIRWWWLGVAVTNDEIERELVQIREAGFGGIEIQAVGPPELASPLDADRTLPFLSAGFLDSLAFAAAKAKELGLTVDLAIQSGWPAGGPHIKPEQGARRLGGDPSQWPQGTPTRQETHASVEGGAGLALDPFSSEAVAQQLRVVGDKLLRALGDAGGRAVVADRLDLLQADWTQDFSAQFKHRRGYDVSGLLYSLTTHEPDTADLRHDFALTLSELLDERYFGRLQEWCHDHRMRLRASLGGTLPTPLSSLRFADLPEGQGLPWNQLVQTRLASSAAHAFDKPASAVLWTESPAAFRASPLDLKVDADQAFLAGATQVVGQSWPYSPPAADAPGWVFDGAAAINSHNPWWPVMPELALYLRRATFVLRQGEPVADVAIYLPTHDGLSELGPGNVNLGKALADQLGPDLIPTVLASGLAFDLIDDHLVQQLAEPRGNRLAIGKNAYAAVILPNVERLPAATLAKLEAFAAGGGTLIATRRLPSKLPGAQQSKSDNERLRATIQRLFDGENSVGQLVRDETGELGGLLRKSLTPDLRTAIASPHIGFVHRKTSELDFYFVVNTASVAYDNSVDFRVAGRSAEWWDLVSGEVSPAQVVGASPTTTKLRLSLPPYGSKVLVFGLPSHERNAKLGKRTESASPLSMDLSNSWEVSFEGTPLRKHVEWLTSWTESADTRTFSGEAVYRKAVVIKQPQWLAARKLVLDFGEAKPRLAEAASEPPAGANLEAPVREAAIVFVNGQRAGSTWCPPYQVEVSRLFHEGVNTLEIHVYDLGSNQLAGRPRPRATRDAGAGDLFEILGKSFLVPLPAGLVGTITLRSENEPK